MAKARDGKMGNILLAVGASAFAAFGQLFFKYAFQYTQPAYLAGFLALGMAVYGISTALYLALLSRSHLSWAYGMGGLAYLFAAILAYFVLGEAIDPLRWTGIVAVVAGILMIGAS